MFVISRSIWKAAWYSLVDLHIAGSWWASIPSMMRSKALISARILNSLRLHLGTNPGFFVSYSSQAPVRVIVDRILANSAKVISLVQAIRRPHLCRGERKLSYSKALPPCIVVINGNALFMAAWRCSFCPLERREDTRYSNKERE